MQSSTDGRGTRSSGAGATAPATRAYPLLVEFGTEVNGDWFPWNGRWNGAGRTDGYGDPRRGRRSRALPRRLPPDRRSVPRRGRGQHHLVLPRRRGRLAASALEPDRRATGPGIAYVDWIGLSDYGPQKAGEPWVSFRRRLDRVYDRVAALRPRADRGARVRRVRGSRPSGAEGRTGSGGRSRDVAAGRWPRSTRSPTGTRPGETRRLALRAADRLLRSGHPRLPSRHRSPRLHLAAAVRASRSLDRWQDPARNALSPRLGWRARRPRSAGTGLAGRRRVAAPEV